MIKFDNAISKVINCTFLVVFFAILTVVITLSDSSFNNYYFAFKLLIPYYLNIFVGLLMIFAAFAFCKIVFKEDKVILCKQRRNVLIFTALFFLIQTFLIYNYYFETDWDVQILIETARSMANSNGIINHWYYQENPNNIFLTEIFAFIFFITKPLHLGANDVFSIIVSQCLLFALSAIMLYQFAYSISNRRDISAFALMLYSLFVGLSPWFSITYSDTFGIVFPIAILWFYSCKCFQNKTIIKWILISAISIIGFKIKPQTIFPFFVILIFELFSDLSARKSLNRKQIVYKILPIFIGLFFGYCGTYLCVHSFQKCSESVLGVPHYLMLGMNSKSHGDFSDEDLMFARQFSTNKERNKAEFDKALHRINEMKCAGFCRHIAHKTLLTFNDGTFYWGYEGDFYKNLLPKNNQKITNFLQNIYFNRDFNGKFFDLWSTLTTALWLSILFSTIFCAVNNRNKHISVLMCSLLTLVAFQLTFETRSRYLISYLPFFVLCATFGTQKVCNIFKQLSLFFDSKIHIFK